MLCHMTQDHTTNHATFRLLRNQKASAHVFLAELALRPPSVFSVSFRMDVYMSLPEAKGGPMLRNTRSAEGCLDASVTQRGSHRRASQKRQTKACKKFPKLFRSFFSLRSILRSTEAMNVKIGELNIFPKMCDRNRTFNRVLDGSLHFTLRHFTSNAYFVLRKKYFLTIL